MKYLFIMTLMFSLTACNYEESDNIKSGGNLTDPMSDAGIGLSYRIKNEAILHHHFTLLVSQSRTWEETMLPVSWPEPRLDLLKQALCYLAKVSACSFQVENFSLTEISSTDRMIKFNLLNGEKFVLHTKQDLSSLSWDTERDQVHMKKISSDQWEINIMGEILLWTPSSKKVCYQETCTQF